MSIAKAAIEFDEIADWADSDGEDATKSRVSARFVRHFLAPEQAEELRLQIVREQRRLGVAVDEVVVIRPKKSKGFLTIFAIHFSKNAEKEYVLDPEDAREFQHIPPPRIVPMEAA